LFGMTVLWEVSLNRCRASQKFGIKEKINLKFNILNLCN